MAELFHHNSGIVIPRNEYEQLTEALTTIYKIGAVFAPRLIEKLDDEDGDADLEDDDPLEDDNPREQDDPPEEDDPAGVHDEDGINTGTGALRGNGPGCPLADPGGCEHDGREPEDGF